mgnify:CR=1 FL=1
MIIGNFYFVHISVGLPENDAPLVVNPDTVMTGPVPFQLLQSIIRWTAKLEHLARIIQHPQLAPGDLLDIAR